MQTQNRELLRITHNKLFNAQIQTNRNNDYNRLMYKYDWVKEGSTYYGHHSINDIDFMTTYSKGILCVYIIFPTGDSQYIKSIINHPLCYLQSHHPSITIVGWEYPDSKDIEGTHKMAMLDTRKYIQRFFV